MNKNKPLLAIIIFLIGLAGVLSLLGIDFPLPEEARKELEAEFTPIQIKLLLLINPMIMLAAFTVLGTVLANKVKLGAPIIQSFIEKRFSLQLLKSTLAYGTVGGILAGVILTLTSAIYLPLLPESFLEAADQFKPTLAMRFLYGGFTEEIIMRFGLMSLIVWLASKVLGSENILIYWIGIVIAAILFALGHFPIVFMLVENPDTTLLSYILIANALGGIIFGWMYWKKGLEAAFMAHIFAHVVMVSTERFMS